MLPDLAALYDAHAPAIYAFALNLTRQEDAAREVLQEVFLRVARDPAKSNGVREMRSWLFRLTHNLSIDRHRRQDTYSRAIDRATLEPVSPFVPHIDPDEQGFRNALAAAMADLPEDQRAVVHLKLWEDLTFSEIAEALDLSPNTAASRYRYATDKLQAQLRPLYDEIR